MRYCFRGGVNFASASSRFSLDLFPDLFESAAWAVLNGSVGAPANGALIKTTERNTSGRTIEHQGLTPTAPYDAFIDVIERDAKSSQAAIQLVLAQPAISSQMVDNLNASIHVRALLTDVFLIDELLKQQ